jgi:hypothetical protein
MKYDITDIFQVLFIIFHTLCGIPITTLGSSGTLCIFYVFDDGQAFNKWFIISTDRALFPEAGSLPTSRRAPSTFFLDLSALWVFLLNWGLHEIDNISFLFLNMYTIFSHQVVIDNSF